MKETSERSLALHLELGGKIETGLRHRIHNPDDLSLLYTPGVAAVCTAIGNDKALARKLTIKGKYVAIVSDGSAILGLGDLGAEAALPVMEGKAVLFKQLGGVDAFPLCVEAHDVEDIVRLVKQVAPNFGGINLEDISAPRCFEIERRLKQELDIPVMHDDQWGTATIVLAGLINALHLRHLDKEKAEVVVNGAGAAGLAIAKLLLAYGFKNIIIVDTKGAIYEGRPDLRFEGEYQEKYLIAQKTNRFYEKGNLAEAVHGADIFIGVSAPNILSAEMVQSMNDRPIIFALSNPIPEVMPDVAHEAGAFIVATGSSQFPNQCNNCLVFPGVFRGALEHDILQITEGMLICVAEAIAGIVEHPTVKRILPLALDRHVPIVIADAIGKCEASVCRTGV
ncbi:MAG: NADP-dependent malic enzyme [Candidatus Paceibacterota bacterium]|jgi:malate dehydrogenase (oxaloacetate-decarboxylating)|nr:NADP-dependent malic enzyme [Candidatus Paceibacterota bacterium]